MSRSETIVTLDECKIEFDALFGVGYCLGVLFEGGMGCGSVGVVYVVFGISFDRECIVCDRLFEILGGECLVSKSFFDLIGLRDVVFNEMRFRCDG